MSKETSKIISKHYMVLKNKTEKPLSQTQTTANNKSVFPRRKGFSKAVNATLNQEGNVLPRNPRIRE